MKKIVFAVALVIGAAWAAEGYKVIGKIKIGGEGSWDYVDLRLRQPPLCMSPTTPPWK